MSNYVHSFGKKITFNHGPFLLICLSFSSSSLFSLPANRKNRVNIFFTVNNFHNREYSKHMRVVTVTA